MTHSETIRVHAALILVSLIYGYFYVAVKLVLQQISPAQLILLRFVLTALIALLAERMVFRRPLPTGSDRWKIIGLGLLGVFLVQILVVWGLHLTTAFHSALIMATIPILTLLFGILLGRETVHWQKLLGILIGFAGVGVLLFFSKNPHTPLPPTYLQGDFIVLLNAMAFSWFLLGSQKILQRHGSFSFMAYCYIVSAVLFSGVFLVGNVALTGSTGFDFLWHMGWREWALVAYVVLFASIGSYTLNNFALRRVSPSVVAIYIFIQPIVSAVSGFYILAEPFNLPMAVAAAITFAGVLLATTASHKGVYLRRQPEALGSIEPDFANGEEDREKNAN